VLARAPGFCGRNTLDSVAKWLRLGRTKVSTALAIGGPRRETMPAMRVRDRVSLVIALPPDTFASPRPRGGTPMAEARHALLTFVAEAVGVNAEAVK